jgi:hypothetical protein
VNNTPALQQMNIKTTAGHRTAGNKSGKFVYIKINLVFWVMTLCCLYVVTNISTPVVSNHLSENSAITHKTINQTVNASKTSNLTEHISNLSTLALAACHVLLTLHL